jgi:hypothetical protein
MYITKIINEKLVEPNSFSKNNREVHRHIKVNTALLSENRNHMKHAKEDLI